MNGNRNTQKTCAGRTAKSVCLRLAAVTLMAALGACASTQGSVRDDAQIQELMSKRAQAAKQAERNAAELALQTGKMALKTGDHVAAYKAYIKAYKDDTKNAEALYGLAESLLGLGEAEKASAAFTMLIDMPSLKAAAMQGRGLALAMLNRHQEAEGLLRAAAKLDPMLWRAWNGVGQINDARGNWKAAKAAYDNASKANPKAAAVYNNRGVSHLVRHDYQGAARDFRLALSIAPDMHKARGNLRVALAWQGKYVEALVGVTAAEAPTVFNNLGYIAMKRGDYEGAEAYLAQAMQLSPAYYAKAAEKLAYLRQIRKIEEVAPKKGMKNRRG